MTAPVTESSSLRMRIVLVVVGCLFAALFARLWFLQVDNASAATAQVNASEYVRVYVPAPRGEILDRSGQVLAGNEQVAVLDVSRQDEGDTTVIHRLAVLLGETPATVSAAINSDQYSPVEPVPVGHPTPAQMLYVDEHASLFPGVVAATEDIPYATPLGVDAGDVIGYVGQINAAQLASFQKRYPSRHYQAGDIVGETGIEEEFQQYLAGTPGVEEYRVDPRTQQIALAHYIPPVPGDNVVLTLSGHLQAVADSSILQGEAVARTEYADNGTGHYKAPAGAAVVEDPHNGQIYALASEPYLDVNEFDRGITQAELDQVDSNVYDQEDWAIQGAYAPGSTFKLATATAGLHFGIVTPSYIFNDTKGYIVVDGHVFHDDAGVGAGYIDLAQALTVSSDNYFNTIGEDLWDERAKLGPLAFQDAAYSYGFGEPTGIDLPGGNANPGLIPTPAQQVQLKKEEPNNPDALGYWVVGDSIEMGIGQFQVEVTPLQLANAYSTFDNGGTRYKPQIVLRIVAPSGRVVKRFGPTVVGHSMSLTPADRAAMIQGYLGVTHNPLGTGYPVFAHSSLADEDIAGKTGTAQNSCTGCQDTSVFQGFAPATAPNWEVVSFVQDAGYGESCAAPIVRRIFDAIYHKPLNPIDYQPASAI
jgi:penicillin-binding protein 2